MTDNVSTDIKQKSFWRTIFDALGYNQRFFWTTFWLIFGFAVLLIPIFYANASNKILFAPALLWSFSYLMLGSLLGFIFGVPTIITSGIPAPPPNLTAQQAADVNKKAEKLVQANTNLTQISDWLTKVIVGAGLVELTKIPDFIKDVAKKMAKGLAVPGVATNEAYATVFSGGIIVLFSIYGFIFGYLIMRIVLTEIFAD